MSLASIHLRQIQDRSWAHSRSWVWLQKYQYQQYEHQDTNLGYSTFALTIRLGKNPSSLLPGPTTRVQSLPSSFSTSPNVTALRIWTNGCLRLRTTLTTKYKLLSSATNSTSRKGKIYHKYSREVSTE